MTDIADNDTLFRLVPSDNYQGAVLAKIVLDEGIKKVAVTYVNNDYGVGIGETFIDAYKAAGGEVTAAEKHEEKKNSYRSELATLAGAGRPMRWWSIAYAGNSGSTIVKQAIEGGLFTRFIGTDGLRDDALIKEVGADALKTSFFSSPTSPADNPAQTKLHELYNAEFKEGADKAFVDQTYDATFLAAARHREGGLRPIAPRWRRRCARWPRLPARRSVPGEWAKASKLIKAGKDIDYEGAGGSYDFDDQWRCAGLHRQVRRRRRQVQAGRHLPVRKRRGPAPTPSSSAPARAGFHVFACLDEDLFPSIMDPGVRRDDALNKQRWHGA